MGLTFVNAQNQGVAINTDGSQADASAMLDVKSATGGVLVPRMDMTARNGISGPATGLLIYQTDNTPGFYYYDGSAWQRLEVEGAYDGDWTVSGTDLINANSGNVGIGTAPNTLAKLHIEGRVWQTGIGGSTFFGANAGDNDDLSANMNTFIGNTAGNSNTTGNENVAVGYQSLSSNLTGQQNIAIGNWSMAGSTDGDFNTAVGFNTLLLYSPLLGASSQRNTAIGYEAMKGGTVLFPPEIPSGGNNTAVGYSALFSILSGEENTSVGYQSMEFNLHGNNNTAVGNHAGPATDNLDNTGAFGDHALATSSNQIMLGNGSVTQVKTAGGITVGNTTVTDPGTIRYQGGHFEGWNGTAWVQLDN
ncbi:MAG: hypothetical protein B6D61_05030 [Bacteroidetes bacterium 4484_249]|nr:MAG: hypothetical protein B6D61_05030 [Bacteroidetes bacterium 4484_249]